MRRLVLAVSIIVVGSLVATAWPSGAFAQGLLDLSPIDCVQAEKDMIIFRGEAINSGLGGMQPVTFAVVEPFYGVGPDQVSFDIVPDSGTVVKQGQIWSVYGRRRESGGYWWTLQNMESPRSPRFSPFLVEALRDFARGATPTQIFGQASIDGVRLPAVAVQIHMPDRNVIEQDTDADGEFLVTGLTPGKYRITATHETYTMSYDQEVELVRGGCGVASLELRFEGSVAGVVRDMNGDPVPYITVMLDPMSDQISVGRIEPRQDTTVTNENGEFQFLQVSPGAYVVGSNLWAEPHPVVTISESSREASAELSLHYSVDTTESSH